MHLQHAHVLLMTGVWHILKMDDLMFDVMPAATLLMTEATITY